MTCRPTTAPRLGVGAHAALATFTALLAVGCAAPPPPPWARYAPGDLLELRVHRQAFADGGDEETFEPDRTERIALAHAVSSAIAVPSDKVAPAVAVVRYALEFLAEGAAWRLELRGEDVFAHVTTPSAPPRHYRAPRLRGLLDGAFARWDAATRRDLVSFTPRLARFLDNARERAVRDGLVLELAGGPRPVDVALNSGAQLALVPGRLIVVAPAGRVLAWLALPHAVGIHAGYDVFRVAFDSAGTSKVVSAPDRDGHPESEDPLRWQPFPLHHDLVLIEPDTGHALFLDVRPREIALRVR